MQECSSLTNQKNSHTVHISFAHVHIFHHLVILLLPAIFLRACKQKERAKHKDPEIMRHDFSQEKVPNQQWAERRREVNFLSRLSLIFGEIKHPVAHDFYEKVLSLTLTSSKNKDIRKEIQFRKCLTTTTTSWKKGHKL